VITNPTHYAVALEYQRARMSAPVVVAKGKGFLAQRIKAIAREHGVPMVEHVPLAQALYKHVEIGQAIPANLFEAVAEVLAHLIRLRQLPLTRSHMATSHAIPLPRSSHLFAPAAAISVVLLMVLPLPPLLLDVLLSIDIGLAVVLLLTAVYVREPIEFSVFPSLLLVLTMFRLALNVASTRLVLLNGGE